jgi:hypothetical protein
MDTRKFGVLNLTDLDLFVLITAGTRINVIASQQEKYDSSIRLNASLLVVITLSETQAALFNGRHGLTGVTGFTNEVTDRELTFGYGYAHKLKIPCVIIRSK